MKKTISSLCFLLILFFVYSNCIASEPAYSWEQGEFANTGTITFYNDCEYCSSIKITITVPATLDAPSYEDELILGGYHSSKVYNGITHPGYYFIDAYCLQGIEYSWSNYEYLGTGSHINLFYYCSPPTTTSIYIPTTTTTASTGDIIVTNHVMTKAVNTESCEIPTSTDTFYYYDKMAYCWCFYKNISWGDEIRWNWYQPNGNFFYSNYLYSPYYGSACAWSPLYISGYSPAYISGKWHVDVYFKGVKKFTEYFTIIGITSTTTTIQPVQDTFSISGYVAGDIKNNVSITLSGTATETVITDLEGYYEFTDMVSGNYLITPEKEEYSFEPPNYVIPNLNGDLYDMIFVSTRMKSALPCVAETIYEQSAETELLRYFRDNVLSQTIEGQELIRLYYQWSPSIVKAMEGDEEFKEEIREMIEGVLPLIRGE